MEAGMKKLGGVLCFVCLLSCVGWTQVKSSVTWKCDKPAKQYSIDVGDKPGHAYAIDQITCTPTKGDIDGAKRKSGMGTEFLYITGDKFSGHGEFIETMENGEKNIYTYEMKGALKNGALQAGSDTWKLTEGAGKLKGAKASGSCKGAGNPDQSATWDCAGDYTMAKK
jgi:hypothetical protein